ncbi:hypothetical protein GX586_10680 [bacterium]|nr:hypothetical protein [bacterium]
MASFITRARAVIAASAALAVSAAPEIPEGKTVAALQAFLDPESEAVLTQVWTAAMAVPTVSCAMGLGARPHITFASWLVTSNELEELVTRVSAAQQSIPARDIALTPSKKPSRNGSVGYDLLPVEDGTLSNYHASVHESLAVPYQPYRPIDLPGRWKQHLTMFSCGTAFVERVDAIFARAAALTNARITSFGLVTFGPIKTLCEIRCAPPAETLPPLVVNVNAGRVTGRLVTPLWARMNTSGGGIRREIEPFYREAILMTATGGRRDNDTMLTFDAAGHPVYNFAPLDALIDSVISNGLDVRLVIGNVPSAIAEKPAEERFTYANPGPPRDWDAYAAYISNLFAHLVSRYGLDAVSSWSYRMMTEPDNRAWWSGTFEQYQRIYDVTLAAARTSVPGMALDFGNFVRPRGDWPARLAQWVTNGTPVFAEGALPRKAGSLSLSCYGLLARRKTPQEGDDQMGNDPRDLADVVAALRQSMLPLGGLPVVVEEGMLLRDEDNRRIWGGEATELGAAWYAALYKVCYDAGVSRYLAWGHRAGTLKTPGYNTIELYRRMEGAPRLAATVTVPEGAPGVRYADALAARGDDGAVRVLAFHYSVNRHAVTIQPVALRIAGLADGACTRRHWRIDRHHSNFFTQWLADSAHIKRHNLPVGRQREWSGTRYDQNVSVTLQKSDRGFWFEKEKTYGALDDLELFEPDRVVRITNSVYHDELELPANSVSLIELVR